MFAFRFVRSRIALTVVLFMAFGLIAGSLPVLAQEPGATGGCSSADNPNDPCFANVDDILQGERRLLPVDDLVVSYGRPNSDRSSNANVIVNLTKGSHISATSQAFEVTPHAVASASGVGRMFNLPRDVIVSATQGRITIRDQGPPIHVAAFPLTETPVPGGLTMADFNGDGFDDFVLAQTDLVNGTWRPFLEFVTAKDVNDLYAGIDPGPYVPADFQVGGNGLGTASITSGDLDGDGAPEVIVASADPANFALVKIDIYRFSRDDAQLKKIATTSFNPASDEDHGITRAIVMVGNFTGATPSQSGSGVNQLAVVSVRAFEPQPVNFYLTSIAIDADKSRTPAALTPVVKSSMPVVYASHLANAKAGRLNWQSSRDEIVIGFDGIAHPHLAFYRINNDDALSFTKIADPRLDELINCSPSRLPGTSLRDIAIGNYDQLDDSSEIEIPKTLQVSVLYANFCSDTSQVIPGLAIYDLDLSNGAVNFVDGGALGVGFVTIGGKPPRILRDFPLTLAAGDIQGRSLLLGTPTKATVTQHIQPDTILGLPPMHLDWLEAVGADAPSVLNLTVYPEKYNAQYNFETSSSKEASRQSTTSFTYGFEESAEEKISYGIPGIASVSVTLKESAKQMFNRTVAKTFNHYTKQSFRLDASTVFDDLVAATVERVNIYSYPVIGHCVKDSGGGASATGGDDSCPAGQHPLVLQFSGPDQVIHLQPTEGAGLEWYQPPQQPGQVFSYPGNLAQLRQEQLQTASGSSRLQLLSSENSAWGSQGGNELVTVNWTEGKGSKVSSGSTSTYSFDESVSVSGSANIEGFGLSGNATFAANQSASSSTLNTSAISFADSTGITLKRGLGPDATTTSRAYLYEGQAFIFGQKSPAGTIDDLTPGTKVEAQGFITVGYAADPLSTGGIQSGNWWKQTYNLPDIALNHPQRWQQTTPQGTNPERVAFNCLVGFSSSFTAPKCTPNGQTPNPRNVATAAFYQMKGLLVTPGTTTDGPQITRITSGDTVTLRARVYNYSLANLPSDSTVHVQFYAQPWDGQHGQFTAGSGPHGFAKAVFIGEDVLDPIPAFCGGSQPGDFDPCSAPDAPLNWVYAKTTWDTSKLLSTTDTYWKFWVVAFPENSGGGVSEMLGHGLAAIPPASVNSLADVQVETYSNNLGFYNQVFTVVAKTAPSPESENAPKSLTVESVSVSTNAGADDGVPAMQAQLNSFTQIRAHHHLTGPALNDVLVLFYDGDPAQGGKLFDMENLPRIQADSDFVTGVPFQPRSCGPHTLFVKAISMDGTALSDVNMTSINVTMDPIAELTRMRRIVWDIGSNWKPQMQQPDDWYLDWQMKSQLLKRLGAAQRLFQEGQDHVAMNRLDALGGLLNAQRGKKISAALANALGEDINHLLGCLSM